MIIERLEVLSSLEASLADRLCSLKREIKRLEAERELTGQQLNAVSDLLTSPPRS